MIQVCNKIKKKLITRVWTYLHPWQLKTIKILKQATSLSLLIFWAKCDQPLWLIWIYELVYLFRWSWTFSWWHDLKQWPTFRRSLKLWIGGSGGRHWCRRGRRGRNLPRGSSWGIVVDCVLCIGWDRRDLSNHGRRVHWGFIEAEAADQWNPGIPWELTL